MADHEGSRLLKCLRYRKDKPLLTDLTGKHSETEPLRLTRLVLVLEAEVVAHIKTGEVVDLEVGEDGEDTNLRQILC